jgi:hypothetical protein
VLRVALVFVLLGPPIGAVAFYMWIELIGYEVTRAGIPDFSTGSAVLSGLLASYGLGMLPAALGGLAVGLWQGLRGSVPVWGALAVSALIWLGIVSLMGLAESHPLTFIERLRNPLMSAFLAAFLVSALACWAIIRRWSTTRP